MNQKLYVYYYCTVILTLYRERELAEVIENLVLLQATPDRPNLQ